MATEEKKPQEANNTVRNVIIGVLTTVLVSAIVYFLGFSKPKPGPSRLDVENATVNAWTAYTNLDNIYTRNSVLLMRDIGKFGGYKGVFLETKKESKSFNEKLQKLTEDENIDKDMITVLKRRLRNEETLMPAAEKFYYEMDTIVKIAEAKDWEVKQLEDSLLACQRKYQDQFKGMVDRAITEIEELGKTLTERYHRPFDSDDFFIIQIHKYNKDIFTVLQENKNKNPLTEEGLAGKWDVSGSTVMIYADSKWSWFVPIDSSMVEGNWNLKKNRLVLNVEKSTKPNKVLSWPFEVLDFTESSMVLRLDTVPNTLYTFVKK